MKETPRPDWVSQNLWEPKAMFTAPKLADGLTDNRTFATVRKVDGVTAQDMAGRMGVTAVMGPDVPDNLRSLWLKSEVMGFTGKKDGSQITTGDMERLADILPLCPVEGNEFGEGPYALYPHDSELFYAFYRRRKQRYEAAGLPYRNYGIYGCLQSYQHNYPWRKADGSVGKPTDPEFRRNYASVEAARKSNSFLAKGFDQVVGANVKNYVDIPDYRRVFYSKHDAMRVMGKGMGKKGGMGPGYLVYFDWPNLEGLDGAHDLHNGLYLYRTVTGDGDVVITTPHIKIDYDWQVQNILVSGFAFGDGYVTFDTNDLYSMNTDVIPSLNESSKERANTVRWESKKGRPAPVAGPGYFEEPCRNLDAGYEAAYLYHSTAATAGNPWRDAEFEWLDTGKRYTPKADESGILDVAQDEAPLVICRDNGRDLSVIIAPNQAPDTECRLRVRVNGMEVLETTTRGSKAQVYNGTLA